MESSWSQMFSMAFALFLLMDSIGNVPIFMALLKDVDPKRHRWIIMRELLIALVIIIAFQFVGDLLMGFLHVSMPTIMISGGIILFLISIKMVFPVRKDTTEPLPEDKEPFIVPMAIPLVAGPAVLAAVMLYAGQQKSHWILISSVILAWGVSTLILLSSAYWKKLLGPRGLSAAERLMGLILTLIAVQMLLEGCLLFAKQQA